MQNLKKNNPGMSFTDVGRALGDKWKKMTGMAFLAWSYMYICCLLPIVWTNFFIYWESNCKRYVIADITEAQISYQLIKASVLKKHAFVDAASDALTLHCLASFSASWWVAWVMEGIVAVLSTGRDK